VLIMPELFELGIDSTAVSIVERYGHAAPARIAAEAVELLEAGNFDGYVALKQILRDIEDLLAERQGALGESAS
jgi:hypothetical protein